MIIFWFPTVWFCPCLILSTDFENGLPCLLALKAKPGQQQTSRARHARSCVPAIARLRIRRSMKPANILPMFSHHRYVLMFSSSVSHFNTEWPSLLISCKEICINVSDTRQLNKSQSKRCKSHVYCLVQHLDSS